MGTGVFLCILPTSHNPIHAPFHVSFVVGTGCSGPMAARLAIALAQRQLAQEAGVHLWTRNFAVINTVGAVSLRATLNCEAFANQHRATSHYDLHSFVGLAWRPTGESICCEIYGTGRGLAWPLDATPLSSRAFCAY